MIVTIVASIAGLVTTGVATLFNAMVADDQLSQSQQAAEEKRRAQAARFSSWVDMKPDGTLRLHLMNRSPDPIANIHLKFKAYFTDRDTVIWDMKGVSFAVHVPGVPPCSEMVLTRNNMKYRDARTDKDGDSLIAAREWSVRRDQWNRPLNELPTTGGWLEVGKTDLWIFVDAADFNDRDGVRWRRTPSLLTRNPPEPRSPNALVWGVVQAVPPQPLKSCGS
ncbi:hypothetical protein [Streptomyces erythrochromogenes]|uniref:hypothetical protein n=1 Tax=Streptomyces erythrochromogenes TaxID=285574 RepID=UPI0004CCB24C|nr:hypothetical protein [Streptomyces erythrochromogenes]